MQLTLLLLTIGCSWTLAATINHSHNGLAELLANHGGLTALLHDKTRIVGGQPADITEFPWIVSMLVWGSHHCGASIIAPHRALTAAHCTSGMSHTFVSLRAGSTDNRNGGQLVQTAAFVSHPQYNPRTLDNDIAVVHMADHFNMDEYPRIAQISMPAPRALLEPGTMSSVAGWGSVCEGCAGTSQLRSVDVPIISNEECSRLYDGGITRGMLCAGFPEGGRDACQGDSGGPLSADGHLVGVVSWGAGCARPRSPGVYADVAFYREWVDEQL